MPISIRLPDETVQRLSVLAQATGRTKTYYIREALDEYLDDLEDIYLAKQTLERIRRGEEQTSTLDEVEKELGLGD